MPRPRMSPSRGRLTLEQDLCHETAPAALFHRPRTAHGTEHRLDCGPVPASRFSSLCGQSTALLEKPPWFVVWSNGSTPVIAPWLCLPWLERRETKGGPGLGARWWE